MEKGVASMNPNPDEVVFALAVEKSVENRPVFLDSMCDAVSTSLPKVPRFLAAAPVTDYLVHLGG